MMSLNGITKGTEFESMMKSLMQGEANGVMMYYALAQLAREQGLEDVAVYDTVELPTVIIQKSPFHHGNFPIKSGTP